MPAADPRAVAEVFYDAFRTGDVASLDGAFAPDWTDHTLPAGRPPGLDGMKGAILALRAAAPDLGCTVRRMHVADDTVSVHLAFTGTHTAPFNGIPPSGGAIDFIAFDMHRIAGGRIAESWHLEDNLTVLQQMGALPGAPPEAAPADEVLVADDDVASVPFPIPGTVPEDGVTAKLLQLDAAISPPTAIIEIRAGTTIPRHVHHATAEMHYVLEGDFVNDGIAYGPGALFAHPAGTPHGPHSSVAGCRVLTVQPETVDASDFEIVAPEG